MKPMTSSSATGSFIPDSPSSERATRLSRVEFLSTAKIAAESVAAIAEPTIIPSSQLRSKITFAATPARSAVASVPTVASEAAGPSTGGLSHPADPLGPGQHAEAEEQQQRGDADPVRQQRPGDPEGQQDAGDQDQDGVVVAHARTLGKRQVARRPRRSMPTAPRAPRSSRAAGRPPGAIPS